MDVKHVNPFIESFMSVMPQLGFSDVRKGDLSVKSQELSNSGVIIIVGIVGQIRGNVAYAMHMDDARKIASTMMMGMPVDELNEMAQSALSELTNMLTANAATCFAAIDVALDISTPTLLYGNDISAKMSSNQVLCIRLFANDIPIDVNIAFEK